MPMVPLYTICGEELAFREMRTATVLSDPDLPPGPYGFLELYCDEEGCDCRRVLIQVISPQGGPKVWATIGFGWEAVEFYVAKMHGNREHGLEMKGPALDPINPQTQYAPALLRLFERTLEDEAYVARLRRHYQLLKDAIRQRRPPQSKRSPKRRR